jgi:putative membrane protein
MGKICIKGLSFMALIMTAGAFAHEGHGLSDAEIAHIVVTANAIDIEAGKFAVGKSTSDEVKQFAQLMVTDHGGVNEQAVALATKLGVTPLDNETSQKLSKDASVHAAKIKKLKGRAFDAEYVNHEVDYHVAVLAALDTALIPAAHNEELKGLMVKVRPAFVAHLAHARSLQAKIGMKR